MAYLTESLPIISGWFGHKLINYLQSRNPNIPSISKKLSLPLRRSSLTSQTAYWRAIIGHKAMHCIYSGAELEPNNFSLDHFIAWSFVRHDQLWNLIPVSPSANSAKSNRLPSEKYLGAFISIHSSGLKTSRQILGKIEWSKKTEPFVSDLRITYSDLLNTRALQTAYHFVVPAMLSIAKQTGFSAEWQY